MKKKQKTAKWREEGELRREFRTKGTHSVEFLNFFFWLINPILGTTKASNPIMPMGTDKYVQRKGCSLVKGPEKGLPSKSKSF